MSGKLFIKTYGCQMNEYDSDKMADVLRAAAGLRAHRRRREADLILFNTCSVREKAQEKVFSRPRPLQAPEAERGVLIGVGGCVASQEGEAIIKRAPYVDRGVRPADPAPPARSCSSKAAPAHQPQVDISFPEIEKFDHLPAPRAEGPSAFVSIMEGCSKYCSYCVVPYTRGDESQPPVRRRAGGGGAASPSRACAR
jgi:tRNA-2-methylthio-N6-dimethylallyladenosine synthase